MECHGNIMLVQQFGGIAWFSLAYGCNDNKEDNNYVKEGGESVTYTPTERLNRRGWPRLKGDSVHSERSTSFLCYAKLGEFVVKCSDAVTVEVDILCHTLAVPALQRLIVISRERS